MQPLRPGLGLVRGRRREPAGDLRASAGGPRPRVQAREAADYRLAAERQCDYCLEPYLDDCTKCRHDFCAWHAGDIDGLCGGCI